MRFGAPAQVELISRLTRLGLVCALALSARTSLAHADGLAPDVGVRVGFGGQTHHGWRTHFVGSGLDLGVEAGVRVSPALSIRIGFERAPQLGHEEPVYGEDGDIELRDIAIVGIADLHLDRFFVGAGAGWVHESIKRVVWGSDNLGPTGPDLPTYTRTGQLVLARAGVRLVTAHRVSLNLVMQLTAQRITEPEYAYGPLTLEHAYGASLGIELRGLTPTTTPSAPSP
jgi:hypothetical protein